MKKVPYYQSENKDFYKDHYQQTGGSLTYFAGVPHLQQGSGLLGNIIRAAVPLVKKGLKFVLPEAVKLGKNVIHDVAAGKGSVKKSLRKRGLQAVGNIAQSAVSKKKPKDIFS